MDGKRAVERKAKRTGEVDGGAHATEETEQRERKMEGRKTNKGCTQRDLERDR